MIIGGAYLACRHPVSLCQYSRNHGFRLFVPGRNLTDTSFICIVFLNSLFPAQKKHKNFIFKLFLVQTRQHKEKRHFKSLRNMNHSKIIPEHIFVEVFNLFWLELNRDCSSCDLLQLSDHLLNDLIWFNKYFLPPKDYFMLY